MEELKISLYDKIFNFEERFLKYIDNLVNHTNIHLDIAESSMKTLDKEKKQDVYTHLKIRNPLDNKIKDSLEDNQHSILLLDCLYKIKKNYDELRIDEMTMHIDMVMSSTPTCVDFIQLKVSMDSYMDSITNLARNHIRNNTEKLVVNHETAVSHTTGKISSVKSAILNGRRVSPLIVRQEHQTVTVPIMNHINTYVQHAPVFQSIPIQPNNIVYNKMHPQDSPRLLKPSIKKPPSRTLSQERPKTSSPHRTDSSNNKRVTYNENRGLDHLDNNIKREKSSEKPLNRLDAPLNIDISPLKLSHQQHIIPPISTITCIHMLDSHNMIIGNSNGEVSVGNLTSSPPSFSKPIKVSETPISTISTSPTSRKLIIGSLSTEDNIITINYSPSQKENQMELDPSSIIYLSNKNNMIRDIHLIGNDRFISIGSNGLILVHSLADNAIKFIAESQNLLKTPQNDRRSESITCSTIYNDRKQLAIGSSVHNNILIYDVINEDSLTFSKSIQDTSQIQLLDAFYNNIKYILSYNRAGELKIWDTSSPKSE